MILITPFNQITVDQLVDRIGDLVEFPDPLRKHHFLNCVADRFEYYQRLYDPTVHIHQPAFEPLAYIRIYAEMGLMEEVYWLAFLMEVIGHHLKTNWELLSLLYLNENRVPYFTWEYVESGANIDDYLNTKLTDCKGLFLGNYYKYAVLNSQTLNDIINHLKHFIIYVKSYDSFGAFATELPQIFKCKLSLKIHFIYYRYVCTLQQLGLGSTANFPFHLNSQLMVKKALRHLFEEKNKLDIKALHHLYFHLLASANIPLKELVICDSLIHYYESITSFEGRK